jgi:uncharacterized protein
LAPGTARKRRDEERPGFSDGAGGHEPPRSSTRSTSMVAIAGILLAAFVVVMLSLPESAIAQIIQQAPSTTAAAQSGKVTVSVDEIKTKKIVFWDYKKADGTTLPLMAYLSPSGIVNMAVRVSEPCNGYSFRIEGNQLVCNTRGTRWDLETLQGISGDCQEYPPDRLRAQVVNGRLIADEARVARWTPRP